MLGSLTTIGKRSQTCGWRRGLLLTALLVLAGSVLPAQDERPAAKFSVNVNVVNVFVTARDSQGKIVRNLTKDDFTLEEDGRPQEIRYFSQQSDLPLILGLLVDTSPSEEKILEVEREASYKFLEECAPS